MSYNNLNKNTAVELNLGHTGNKKVIKQKGEQNNYFENDYRQKYYDVQEDNFRLQEKIIKLQKNIFELEKNLKYIVYFWLFQKLKILMIF